MHHTDTINVVKIDYSSPSIDNEGKSRFIKFELKKDEDLKTMWSTYHRYETKGLVEMYAIIARFIDDIINMLKCPESSCTV